MKKIFALLLVGLIIYSVYFDLTTGTLPAASVPATAEEAKPELPYNEIEVKPGDTLLSIIEREEGSLPKPIDKIILDFQKLNDGQSPHEMQIEKTYKIPDYTP
ncbi:hypothetical protein IEO70_04595 [Bacillus sp. AGMB 02131]|uniref:LysM domain-containing protein n=1 Tax=Peribacillus faecalis TaxID=2772559 RepID=A0A927CVQ4_9BACI|nr:hypothetical protein [Peribacillus faecalis]MBD3107637.1 hypothetical protein [Peribacillus faecalis]